MLFRFIIIVRTTRISGSNRLGEKETSRIIPGTKGEREQKISYTCSDTAEGEIVGKPCFVGAASPKGESFL